MAKPREERPVAGSLWHGPRALENYPAGHIGGFGCYAGLHPPVASASVVVVVVLRPSSRS